MNRFGLALSGGGFRAVLYHLGLVRFLRDAGILSRVTHISSVSGGSVIGAHLALNWGRYNGSPNEFDAAASELVSFVRRDVRNRIFRRFPLSLPLLGPRWLLGLSNRKLTRTGLLEQEYEKHLYGDTSLFQLPERPELHILATNLSEGCLCSFNRNGLLIMHRQPGTPFASSECTSAWPRCRWSSPPRRPSRGSSRRSSSPARTSAPEAASLAGRRTPTEGSSTTLGSGCSAAWNGGYWRRVSLSADDFFDFPAVVETLCAAGKSGEDAPLRRLGQIIVAACSRPDLLSLTEGERPGGAGLPPLEGPGQVGSPPPLPSSRPDAGNGQGQEAVLTVLGKVLCQHPLHREPLFAGLRPAEPEATALLQASRSVGRVLEAGDQAWLNRHLLEAAFRQVTGHPCFRRLNRALDGILVSDVGKRMAIQGDSRAGGLIRTSLRATDIVMDRVWQLELENFHDSPSFVFAPFTEVVEPTEDPTALHPEIQRQAVNVRTDFDRFSPLEISILVRHGYCVAQGVSGAPRPVWSRVAGRRSLGSHSRATRHRPSRCGAIARSWTVGGASCGHCRGTALQNSAVRRIWSTLLDRRDWTSYVYVPLLIPILVLCRTLWSSPSSGHSGSTTWLSLFRRGAGTSDR